jgi:spermidine/putrescine transport system permease protein
MTNGIVIFVVFFAVIISVTVALGYYWSRRRYVTSVKQHGEMVGGEELTRTGHIVRSLFTSGPGILWVSLFLLVPLLAVGVISFMTRGQYGVISLPWTLDHYLRFLGYGAFGFNPLYPQIVLRSVVLGVGTTVLCIIAAFPLAFFIAAMPDKYKGMALTLAVIPFWTNLLIRTYAWQLLLAPDSWITQAAVFLGLAKAGAPLYPGAFAVFIGMVSAYLPFLILPLYTAVEKIDWSLAEAASDLGANRVNVFIHAILPQIIPGLAAGVVLVLIPAIGQYVVPDLLGGAKTVMLGNAIQQQFVASNNWPFGSAIAFLGMGTVLLGLWIYTRYANQKGGASLL